MGYLTNDRRAPDGCENLPGGLVDVEVNAQGVIGVKLDIHWEPTSNCLYYNISSVMMSLKVCPNVENGHAGGDEFLNILV
jgi:hypothetical protein